MAIGTGSVSMTAINLELGRASNATISLDAAENGSYAAINSCSPSRPSSDNQLQCLSGEDIITPLRAVMLQTLFFWCEKSRNVWSRAVRPCTSLTWA
jgi:hypothetical protein